VDFPLQLLNWHFILTSLTVLAAWWVGNLFAADLALLGADDDAFPDERLKTATVRTLIQRRFLRLGLLVVFLAAIPAQTAWCCLPVASNGVPAALVYFVLGIVLLISPATLAWKRLDAGQAESAHPDPPALVAYSALILVLLVLLISLLPTNYGLGFFATLMAVFHLLAQLVLDVFFLIQLMIALIAHLLGQNTVIPQNASHQINLPTPQPLPASHPARSIGA